MTVYELIVSDGEHETRAKYCFKQSLETAIGLLLDCDDVYSIECINAFTGELLYSKKGRDIYTTFDN